MWKIFSEDKIDIMKKTQENLEATQANTQMLAEILRSNLPVSNVTTEKVEKTDDEKLRAAYALNLCTVSVSQIIDYNDIKFLEYEYDAILNNLNLEKMPKDEALLRILKQLLDVITFFRIQDGDRKMMEREYTQKMKDAIWSAVPNPSMIVAGGSPIAIAVSLASQVGIGYMNYRKAKAQIVLEKERKEWELQRTAMEQFNGLRRELFDTAWRLADEYNFPDEYRITERQITQFNNILLDEDDERRYERLEYISDKFKAYPPFWYYLGNAANAVYQDVRYSISVRHEYKNRAIEHFSRFFKITEENLFREDQLVASCALEMFDLTEDENEKLRFLEKAANASGNALDVLQICAISYLKIGEIDKACDILKMLVNESYNETLNTQLLSRLFVSKIIDGNESYRAKYDVLKVRSNCAKYLFPLPETELDDNQRLTNVFIVSQKGILRENFASIMKKYISNCENRYYEICEMPGNITLEMAELIAEIRDTVVLLGTKIKKNDFLKCLKDSIDNADRSVFNKMVKSDEDRNQGKNKVTFESLFKNPFTYVAKIVISEISDVKDMADVSKLETSFYDFSLKNKVSLEAIGVEFDAKDRRSASIEEEIFGDNYLEKLEYSRRVKVVLSLLEAKGITENTIVKKADHMEFYLRGDLNFQSYMERNHEKLISDIPDIENIVAILNDTGIKNIDLVFTIDRVHVKHYGHFKGQANYKDINGDASGKLVIEDYKYSSSRVNMPVLHDMIKMLAEEANKSNPNSKRLLAYDIHALIMR